MLFSHRNTPVPRRYFFHITESDSGEICIHRIDALKQICTDWYPVRSKKQLVRHSLKPDDIPRLEIRSRLTVSRDMLDIQFRANGRSIAAGIVLGLKIGKDYYRLPQRMQAGVMIRFSDRRHFDALSGFRLIESMLTGEVNRKNTL